MRLPFIVLAFSCIVTALLFCKDGEGEIALLFAFMAIIALLTVAALKRMDDEDQERDS